MSRLNRVRAKRQGSVGNFSHNNIGFTDEPPLSPDLDEGAQSRELSFPWLAGIMVTGLTSVLLMGAALYVSFSDLEGYSTAYNSLEAQASQTPSVADGKTSRARQVLKTQSDREVFTASTSSASGASEVISNATFIRIAATLATSETALTADVTEYAPEDYADASGEAVAQAARLISTEVLGGPSAEVSINYASLPAGFSPAPLVSDAAASAFVNLRTSDSATDSALLLGYVGAEATRQSGIAAAVVENVTVVPKNRLMGSNATSERIVKLEAAAPFLETLQLNGFTEFSAAEVERTAKSLFGLTVLPEGARLRILLGPANSRGGLVPYRVSVYRHEPSSNTDQHVVTLALTDGGRYVVALPPPEIPFPEQSTEQIDIANLPSMYKAIWETGRRNKVPDEVTAQLVTLVSYDADLRKNAQPGDSIELLMAAAEDGGNEQLLYASVTLGGAERRFYRYVSPDGTVEFFNEQGEAGKQFLLRRPLEGGGRLTSTVGTRSDPFNGRNASHEGTDFAAPRGTKVYAAADGTIDMAQWYSGYGRYVRVTHPNGYQTAYAHMNAIADGIVAGTRVRQGQVIGYVGTTGRSTGNHLHFELEINGRVADPLQVKLSRERTLLPRDMKEFSRTVQQIQSIMDMPAGFAPVLPQQEQGTAAVR